MTVEWGEMCQCVCVFFKLNYFHNTDKGLKRKFAQRIMKSLRMGSCNTNKFKVVD